MYNFRGHYLYFKYHRTESVSSLQSESVPLKRVSPHHRPVRDSYDTSIRGRERTTYQVTQGQVYIPPEFGAALLLEGNRSVRDYRSDRRLQVPSVCVGDGMYV